MCWSAAMLQRRDRDTGRKCAAGVKQRQLVGTPSNQTCCRIDRVSEWSKKIMVHSPLLLLKYLFLGLLLIKLERKISNIKMVHEYVQWFRGAAHCMDEGCAAAFSISTVFCIPTLWLFPLWLLQTVICITVSFWLYVCKLCWCCGTVCIVPRGYKC